MLGVRVFKPSSGLRDFNIPSRLSVVCSLLRSDCTIVHGLCSEFGLDSSYIDLCIVPVIPFSSSVRRRTHQNPDFVLMS